MSVDPTSRGLRRIPDTTGSDMQSAEKKIQENPAVNSQQEATTTPKLQNQNPKSANSRKAEAGMMADQLQSQLLNQTNSTGTNRTNNKSGPDGAALQRAFKMYGITDEQLQRYVSTGEEPEGLKKAINDAERKGEWPAVNVVRESFQKRAEYLRANSGPNDEESRVQADQLEAASATLIRNREGTAIKLAQDRLRFSKKYPDNSTRSANSQSQAMNDLEDIGSKIENQLDVQSARLRKK